MALMAPLKDKAWQVRGERISLVVEVSHCDGKDQRTHG